MGDFMTLLLSVLVSTFAMAATIQIGDSAQFKTDGDIEINGKATKIQYFTTETIKTINSDKTYNVEVIKTEKGKVITDISSYSIEDLTRVKDPESILTSCAKLGYKKLNLNYKDKTVDGCEIVQHDSQGEERLILGRVPLYLVFWGGSSSDNDGRLIMSMVNIEVSGY
jgi:hypothetical protein